MKLNITRHLHPGKFSVWLDDHQDLCEHGDSVAEAIGNLVTRYPELFKVELRIRSEQTTEGLKHDLPQV